MFFCQDFCYDHMTSRFIRSCNFNWIASVTSFFTLSGASFVFIRMIKFWSHLTYLTLKKLARERITLIESYLRAVNRSSHFFQNLKSHSLMKRISFFLVCLLTFFFETADLRLYSQIYGCRSTIASFWEIYCGYFLAICQLCQILVFNFLVCLKVLGNAFISVRPRLNSGPVHQSRLSFEISSNF